MRWLGPHRIQYAISLPTYLGQSEKQQLNYGGFRAQTRVSTPHSQRSIFQHMSAWLHVQTYLKEKLISMIPLVYTFFRHVDHRTRIIYSSLILIIRVLSYI